MFRFISKSMVSAAVMLAGCATQIPITYKKLPELPLSMEKTISVEPFNTGGSLNLDLLDTKNDLVGQLANLALDVGSNKFAEKKNPEIQANHQQGLVAAILRNGYYTVSNPAKGLASVQGTVRYQVDDEMKPEEYKDKNGVVKTNYRLHRVANVTVHVVAKNGEGQLVGSADVDGSVEKSWSGESKSQVRNQASKWDLMVQEAVNKTHPLVVKKIAPYTVTENRTLQKGDADGLKAGNKAAGKGNWQEALTRWKDVQSRGSQSDKAAAAYNVGVYYEHDNQLAEALNSYQEANNLSGTNQFARDVERMQVRIEEKNRLHAAEQSRTNKGS